MSVPLYVVKFGEDGYYKAESAWKPIPKEQADKLTHKEALRIRNYLRQPRIGYRTTIEPV